MSRCPKTAGRQLGLLRLLAGNISAAADLLSQAPGLGWSSNEHPGHVLFPSFAVLLAHRTSRRVSDTLLADLDSTCRDPLEVLSPDDVERRPTLGTPSMATLIQDMSSTITFVEEDLKSMVDSMCVAAERRVEGILGSSRRRHYGHAAMLVASCVALAPAGGDKDLSKWMMGLRHNVLASSRLQRGTEACDGESGRIRDLILGPVDQTSSSQAKIALFRSLFRGREDVYPRRFESRKTGRSGYAPACANEWVRGVCEKPRIKCAECPNRRFLPVTDDVIRWHLSGCDVEGQAFVAGVYPLLQDETCFFLAVDFDKAAWRDDAAAFLETCRHLNLPAALERSRSGRGAHVWFFFDEAIPAALAR